MSFITSPGVIVPPLTAGGVAYGTGSQAKVNSAGTAGQFLQSAGAGVPIWADAGAVIRVPRTSNTVLVKTNNSNLIDVTSGTFSQTFTAAATLGNGWFCYIQNSGTGFVTLDPSGSETITRDGVAFTTWVLWPQESALIVCNGTGFYYTNLKKGQIVQTLGTQTSVAFATGVAYRTRLDLTIEGISVDTSAALSLQLNTTNASKTSQIIINTNLVQSATATTGSFNYINNSVSSWALNQTGTDRLFGQISLGFGSIGTTLNGWGTRVTNTSIQEYQYHAGFFDSINSTNVSSFGLYLASGNLTDGTVTVTEL